MVSYLTGIAIIIFAIFVIIIIIIISSKMQTLGILLQESSNSKVIILVNSNDELHAVRQYLSLHGYRFLHTGIEVNSNDDHRQRISIQKQVYSFNRMENNSNILLTTSSLLISNETIPIFADLVIILSDSWIMPFDHRKLLKTCLNRTVDDSLKIITIITQNTLEDAILQLGSFQNLQGTNIAEIHGADNVCITHFDGDANIIFKSNNNNDKSDWIQKSYKASVLADSLFYKLAKNTSVVLKPHKNKAQRKVQSSSAPAITVTEIVTPQVDLTSDVPMDVPTDSLTTDYSLTLNGGNGSNNDLLSLAKAETSSAITSTTSERRSSTPVNSALRHSTSNPQINNTASAEIDDKDLIDTTTIIDESSKFSYCLEFAISDIFDKFMRLKRPGDHIYSSRSVASINMLMYMSYFQANDWKEVMLIDLEERIVGGTVALNQRRLSDEELLRLRIAGVGVAESEKQFWSINRPYAISNDDDGDRLSTNENFQQLIVDCSRSNIPVEKHLHVHP